MLEDIYKGADHIVYFDNFENELLNKHQKIHKNRKKIIDMFFNL
jgi:hypothetical protein